MRHAQWSARSASGLRLVAATARRRVGATRGDRLKEAVLRRALIWGQQPKSLQTCLNRAHCASMLDRDVSNRFACLEFGRERIFLFWRPRLADIVGELRSSVRPCRHGLKRADAGE